MQTITEKAPPIMTREYAVREGFIAPMDDMDEERKHPYIRITNWYSFGEQWMLRNAADTLVGCDFILVVDEVSQALFRGRNQLSFSEQEE